MHQFTVTSRYVSRTSVHAPASRWPAMAGRACLALAAAIFAAALAVSLLGLSEGGGIEPVLYALAFGFFFGIPVLVLLQQAVFGAGQTRGCLFAGRLLGVAWLAAIAWLVGLYL